MFSILMHYCCEIKKNCKEFNSKEQVFKESVQICICISKFLLGYHMRASEPTRQQSTQTIPFVEYRYALSSLSLKKQLSVSAYAEFQIELLKLVYEEMRKFPGQLSVVTVVEPYFIVTHAKVLCYKQVFIFKHKQCEKVILVFSPAPFCPLLLRTVRWPRERNTLRHKKKLKIK